MKKALVIIGSVILILVVLVSIWCIFSGLQTMGGVYIRCYTVTENGSQMNFDVANANSIGYVRAMEDQNSAGKHILKFYPCWGGFNSSLAANNEFTISLNETDSEIYILDGGGYERLALIKDSESGEWIRP